MHGERGLSLQGATAEVPAAEACHGAATPRRRAAPPAGRLRLQHARAAAAAFLPRLNQALHSAAGPPGPGRRAPAAALGAAAGGNVAAVDRLRFCFSFVVDRHCQCSLPAAAGCSPAGVAAPAGAAGPGGHAGVPLAPADSTLEDVSPGSAQLPAGLDVCAAGAPHLSQLKAADFVCSVSKLFVCPSELSAFAARDWLLHPPQKDLVAG